MLDWEFFSARIVDTLIDGSNAKDLRVVEDLW